jgi:hypothetical protein
MTWLLSNLAIFMLVFSACRSPNSSSQVQPNPEKSNVKEPEKSADPHQGEDPKRNDENYSSNDSKSKHSESPNSNSSNSYSEIGNGGNFAKILAQEAKNYAELITKRINLSDERTHDALKNLSPKDTSWLAENLEAISLDLRNSKLVWTPELPRECGATSCGCALKDDHQIFLLEQKCEEYAHDKKAWAKLLIHETMHHFVGSDEDKATKLGIALWSAWTSLGHPDSPHWQIIKFPNQPLFGYSRALWDGNTFTVFAASTGHIPRALYSLNPVSNKWTTVQVAGPDLQSQSWEGIPIILNGETFLFKDNDLLNRFGLDKEQKSWRRVQSDLGNVGSSRGLGALAKVNENKVFSLKSVLNNEFLYKTQAALLNVQQNSWLDVTPGSGLEDIHGAGFAVTPDKVFVFGGFPRRPDSDHSHAGAIYDLHDKSWTLAPTENAPSPRVQPILVGAGNEVIVYGGYTRGPYHTFVRDAAAYNLKENKWRSLTPGPKMPSHLESGGHALTETGVYTKNGQAIWTGTVAIFFINGKIIHYNPYLDEWTHDFSSELPCSFMDSEVVWTGVEALLWGCTPNVGYRYFP